MAKVQASANGKSSYDVDVVNNGQPHTAVVAARSLRQNIVGAPR